jgi:hypothetical protein
MPPGICRPAWVQAGGRLPVQPAVVQAAWHLRIITSLRCIIPSTASPSCQPHPQHQDELRAGCLAGSDSVPAVQPQLPPAWYIIHQTQTDSNTTRNKQARNSPAGEQTLQLDTFQAGGAEGMWRHVDRRGAARCFRRALVHSRTRKKGNLWDLVQGWVPGLRPSACPPPRTRLLT